MGVPEPSQSSPVVLGPTFKLTLLIVTVLTGVSLLVMIGIAATGATNPASQDLFDTCSTAFKIGSGALFGLLGGKAL